MNKRIANVVFYKFWDPTREDQMQQACIFYEDGSVKNVSLDEGLDAAYEIAKVDKIKTQAEFAQLLNTKRVFTLEGSEFERRFKEFLGTGVALVPATDLKPAVKVNPGQPTPSPIVVPPVSTDTKETTPAVATPAETTPETTPVVAPIVVPPVSTDTKETTPIVTTPADDNTQTAPTIAEKTVAANEKKEKKKGLFSRLWAKVTAVILAIAIAFTGGFHLGRNTKCGDIINNNISNIQTQDDIQPQDQAYLNLLKKSTNEDQKTVMTHQGQSLDLFNRDFASAHVEEGKDVRAALTWDEMMALNLAYNTYTKDQIRIMFNGSEVDSTAMSNAYKNATLQLMGAYVISDREHPVNSSQFLVNEDERAFVEKYNDLFLKMKETTGADRVAAIDAFYAELYKDFPIADEVREEGISHADSRRLVEPYKAAVTPIVAAAEIMFQNTDGIDHTLSDKAIAYFNDLGLCNLVDEQFERAETITLSAETDESQPLYQEFRDAKITELIYEGNYPTDDAHRDLSQLDEFQKWVNGHFLIIDGVNTGKIQQNVTTTVTTYTETTSHTETTTTVTDSREEAVAQAGEQAVKDAEAAVDKELEEQNEAAKEQAEKEAAEEAERQQAAADAERESHEAEVEEDDEEMQDLIEDANQEIENGGEVNEEDFGDHNVDFDEEYEDGNGNLDDSVTDITTDDSGAVDENEPLPDPNQTGAVFDGQSSKGTTESSGYAAETSETETSTTTESQNTSGQEIYEYEEPYNGMTNEQIVDAYIASLEGQETNEVGYQYHK